MSKPAMTIGVEGHAPMMGWWDAHGFHAACECGWESGAFPKRTTAEDAFALHLRFEGERGTIIIEQDAVEEADEPSQVEAPDEWDGEGPVPYGQFPPGF